MPRNPEPRSNNFLGMRSQPLYGDKGTWLEPEDLTYPSGGMLRRCKALCEDGKLRIIRCGIPDTFFSIPANGGFITSEEGENGPIFTYHKRQKETK